MATRELAIAKASTRSPVFKQVHSSISSWTQDRGPCPCSCRLPNRQEGRPACGCCSQHTASSPILQQRDIHHYTTVTNSGANVLPGMLPIRCGRTYCPTCHQTTEPFLQQSSSEATCCSHPRHRQQDPSWCPGCHTAAMVDHTTTA